jgi:signal transduction histidine kinase
VIEREVDIDQLEHSSGLGLRSVRWVLDAHGGELAFDTDGDGTTVTLTLPTA